MRLRGRDEGGYRERNAIAHARLSFQSSHHSGGEGTGVRERGSPPVVLLQCHRTNEFKAFDVVSVGQGVRLLIFISLGFLLLTPRVSSP